MEQYQRVYVTKDQDGHDFIIPYDQKDEFESLMDSSYESEDFDEFEEKFNQYMVGGDINEEGLYQKIK